ncbi:penicillin-binding transpeptidase domain-containing protein [Lederbergia wuyishanensis]|uniref:serine-type D-Ala-D-Ala carboxypeptidase n=1 Tax=Lederbergia wuyishanensis TaxID=1347903 RepID=A0ABU0DAG5_9BACI|nr:penicillin-binding transpeptidase domain-containing protein [Lederbergia wuyishanensis]MCJ8009762.1 penicillin-binding transpeptidase domain-containing protein [Lederbergia wuyishanensis]MDQ0345357.1 penicillin-binding protein [Lederbergia wuyishanensis]
MKKFVLISLCLILSSLLVACNKEKEPKPEDLFADYIKLWNEQKFDKMYDFLSTESKENITKEDFVNRYKKIYEDLEIKNLKVQFEKPEEETDKEATEVEFPFDVKMDSLAGEIDFNHKAQFVKEDIDEKKEWLLNWDTSFIFPELEEGDKISVPTTSPKRGSILDRNGIALAENGVARQIGLVPKDMEGQEEKSIKQVSEILGVSTEQIEKALGQSWVQPDSFVPIKTIPKNNMELREKVGQVPGVIGMDVEARVYPLGARAVHLTGNIAPVTADDLEENKGKGYSSSDMIGRRGLEKVFEDRLRGEPGVKIVIQKQDESEVVLAEKEVKDGEDVQLTIDSALQVTIFDQLGGKPGTAAAINPSTGETLALVSSPSYDPNMLTLGATNEEWKALEENPSKPMLNRFNSTFAPGSVLKPITAAIGLKEGTLDWKTALPIKDLSWQKDASWGKYKVTRVSDPGVPIDLEKALVYSDNIYFAQTTLELGKDKFVAGLKAFGFDEDMPFAFPMHTSSIGNIDSDIALADSSYGQGQVEMNVLHLASAFTTFTNNGNMIKPILLTDEKQGEVWKENLLNKDEVDHMGSALRKVVEDPHGTARGARIEGYPLAGKTGTAEFAKDEQGKKGKENSWFVAYNPDHPDTLIALMLEADGTSSAVDKVKNIFTEIKK